MKPRTRVRLAWALLVACVLFWPVFRFLPDSAKIDVLGDLSVLALIFTAWDILATTDVRKEQDEGD